MLLPTAHETNPALLILECGMTAMAVASSFAFPRLGGGMFCSRGADVRDGWRKGRGLWLRAWG